MKVQGGYDDGGRGGQRVTGRALFCSRSPRYVEGVTLLVRTVTTPPRPGQVMASRKAFQQPGTNKRICCPRPGTAQDGPGAGLVAVSTLLIPPRSDALARAGGEGRRRAREEWGKTTALHLFVPSHALLQPSRSTTDMAALSMTYTVVPPPFEPPHTLPSLPTTDTLTYSLSPLVPTSSGPTDTAPTPQEHLIALEVALGLARDDLNARLTGWKAAFGAAGLEKRASTKKGRKAEDDGEDDGEEDEEE